MIKLTKLECPDTLSQNKEKWTKEYMSYIEKGQPPPESVATRYNHSDIKSTVKKETYGKCAYCESYVQHVYPGDIEHIKPKSKYPKLIFEWENLTYVCWQCNHSKLDQYDEDCPPINPYIEDPGDFLIAVRAYIHHRRGNERGRYTKELLKLNRPPLLEDRRRKISKLKIILDRYAGETDETTKKALLSEIKFEIADDKEYSFCKRSVFDQMANP